MPKLARDTKILELWHHCRGDIIKTYQVPSHKLSSTCSYFYLPFYLHLPLVFISPTSHKNTKTQKYVYLLVCSFACFITMTSVTFPPLSPDFEVLYFKQKQGENLKDAWYRMIGFYRVCTIKGDI